VRTKPEPSPESFQ